MSSPPLLPRAALLSALTGLPLSFAAAQANIPTAPGTVVSSSFTLDYTVGGVARTDVPSAPIDFVVDRKVDLSLTSLAPLPTALVDQSVTARYALTNTGNDNQAFSVDLIDDDPGFGNTAMGLVSLASMEDANGNGTPDDSTTPLVAHAASEPSASVASGTLTADLGPGETLWIEATIAVPAGHDAPGAYDFALQVLARQPSAWRLETTASEGELMAADADGLNELGGAAEVLFADGALNTAPATGTLDVAGDAALALVQTLSVGADPVSFTKTVTVLTDDATVDCLFATPVSGALAVAGACVQYQITIENTDTAQDLDGVTIRDTLPSGLVFQTVGLSNFKVATGASQVSQAAPAPDTACDGTAATCEVVISDARIEAGQTASLLIRANID
ncbi:MAG: hypothetical protein ACON4C_07630 [Henriciella sp.]